MLKLSLFVPKCYYDLSQLIVIILWCRPQASVELNFISWRGIHQGTMYLGGLHLILRWIKYDGSPSNTSSKVQSKSNRHQNVAHHTSITMQSGASSITSRTLLSCEAGMLPESLAPKCNPAAQVFHPISQLKSRSSQQHIANTTTSSVAPNSSNQHSTKL